MDGGAWWVAVHGVAKSRTRLSDLAAAETFPDAIVQKTPSIYPLLELTTIRYFSYFWSLPH